jgi:hypothetical protein
VAEDLIDAYGLDDDAAEAVRAIARPLVGRDSPYRNRGVAGAGPEQLRGRLSKGNGPLSGLSKGNGAGSGRRAGLDRVGETPAWPDA